MKKKILIIIITMLSLITFTNKVSAVVMWMQCTDSPEDKIKNNDDAFEYHNTFALIEGKNDTPRHIVYNQNDFFKKLSYILYDYYGGNINGQDIGNICWYKRIFEEMSKCKLDEEKFTVADLKNGLCPTAVYQTEGWQTSGSTKGDFLVLGGSQKIKPENYEELNESLLVIYGFKEKESNNVDIMIEAYDNTGQYGYATTYNKDMTKFGINLAMSYQEHGSSTEGLIYDSDTAITKKLYDSEYMSWTGFTQVMRIKKFGRNFFKLLSDERPWLVGGTEYQKFEVTEEKNGENVMYRSDDSNGNFAAFVEKWYTEYDIQLSKQIEAIETLENEKKYDNALEISKKISDAVDEGQKYEFRSNDVNQLVLDLNDAYDILDSLIGNESPEYKYYDDNCQLSTDSTSDPLGSAFTEFSCNVFGVSSFDYAPHKKNPGLVNNVLASIISNTISERNKTSRDIATIQNDAEEYVKNYALAIKYIKRNEKLTGDAEQIINELVEKYDKLCEEIGVEIIIDCDDLIGDDLREKIRSYLNIFRIAIPILLILFGIIDFTRALFVGDDEKMRKAQKDFIMRVVISVIIFLVPTIVDMILGLANKVWNFIEPGSCGIFNK